MAATMLGARWVDLATGDDQTQNRWWVLQWATGQRTLEKSLPELNFGRLQKGQESAPEEIKAVQEAVAKALPALRSQ
jgi:glutathione S-transferase